MKKLKIEDQAILVIDHREDSIYFPANCPREIIISRARISQNG